MQEFHPRDLMRATGHDAAGVTVFASRVISLLVDRTTRASTELREPLVAGLMAASLSGTRDAFAALLGELRRARISLPALADIYIPEAARRMGDFWLQDQMSWMDVSIGVGRLQSLLREIGAAWAADQSSDMGQSAILLIVPDHEQHTLGPMVAMGQLRRYGVSVCLRFAPSFAELRSLVADRHFDGILVSVSTTEKLAAVGKTIHFLKSVMSTSIPIIVGGAVMSKVEDPAACTGADFSSNDIGAALEAIGLKFDASCVLRRA